MMEQARLRALTARANAKAALVAGSAYAVFRPHRVRAPLAPGSSIGEVGVAFMGGTEKEARYGGYRNAAFDTGYVAVGDYLVSAVGDGTYFVVAEPPCEDSLCVYTNAVVAVFRSPPPTLSGYGFAATADWDVVIEGWPARLLVESGRGAEIRPGSTRLASFTVELPILPVVVLASDVVRDQIGRSFVVVAAEETRFGTRLFLREVGG